MSRKKLSNQISLFDSTKEAPNNMGCYQLFYNGELKYIGKAEDGIRKRFVQHYNGTTAHYPSAIKIHSERENITVCWIICDSAKECQKLESEWIEALKPEWNERSGWKNI